MYDPPQKDLHKMEHNTWKQMTNRITGIALALIVTGLSPCQPTMAFGYSDQLDPPLVHRMADPPNAGADGSLSICSSDAPASLFDALEGEPDEGGTWSGPSPTTGMYDPVTMSAGNYVYTVDGGGLYPNASATVSVVERQAVHAGIGSTVAVCSSGLPFTLTNYLMGDPPLNGQWRNPFGQAISGIFTPSWSAYGIYTYTVSGYPPCPNVSAELVVGEIDMELDAVLGPEDIAPGDTALFEAIPFLPDAEFYHWILPEGWSYTNQDTTSRLIYLTRTINATADTICTRPTGQGCYGHLECFETNSDVGISNTSPPLGLWAFPNPNNGVFQIQCENGKRPILVEILNSLGQQVAILDVQPHTVDLRTMGPGIYHLRWYSANSSGTQRIVIQR